MCSVDYTTAKDVIFARQTYKELSSSSLRYDDEYEMYSLLPPPNNKHIPTNFDPPLPPGHIFKQMNHRYLYQTDLKPRVFYKMFVCRKICLWIFNMKRVKSFYFKTKIVPTFIKVFFFFIYFGNCHVIWM